MRHLALITIALLLSPLVIKAADDLTVLKPGPNDPLPKKQLYAYLEAQAKSLFDTRRKAVAALKTPQDVAIRQAKLKQNLLKALGDLPAQKTALNPRLIGRDQRDGYQVERLLYESRPNHHVTANLYIPDGRPPFPGVLVPCGHTQEGKAGETYQRICILLAKNGLVALCYDPIGQGERVQALNSKGKPLIHGCTTEHTLLGAAALAVGRSAAGYRVWDAIRSLDYLASRPEVEPSRLGCTGNSGGGTETAYLMALDDRILAAVPSCYITSLERLFATIGPQDAEQNLNGQVALGIEHADFVAMRAPKPTLLSVGTQDFFDIRGSWDTYQEVKRIYCMLRQGEKVDIFESDEPHGFTRPRRESSMRWMRRWLLGKDDSPVEAEFPIASEKDLLCTKSSQVLLEFPDEKSAFALNAERASQLDRERLEKFANRTREALQLEVVKCLGLREPESIIVDGHKNRILRDGIRIDKWVLTTEPGVQVPVLLFRHEPPAGGKPMVVYVGASRQIASPGGLVEKHLLAGQSVAIVEPRGMGETTPEDSNAARRDTLGPDQREAFLALHLNRPLLGQRVFDVLQALRALLPNDEPKAFHLIGVGAGGPIVLHAAAIDGLVRTIEIQDSLVSWSALARSSLSRGQLASVIPGVLESYDLPELAASLAPRELIIQGPVDPSGTPLTQTALDAAYALCTQSYKKASASDHLTLKALPQTAPPAGARP